MISYLLKKKGREKERKRVYVYREETLKGDGISE